MFLRRTAQAASRVSRGVGVVGREMTTVIFDEKERGDENRFFRQAEAEALSRMKAERSLAEEKKLASRGKENAPQAPSASDKAKTERPGAGEVSSAGNEVSRDDVLGGRGVHRPPSRSLGPLCFFLNRST